MVGVWDAGGIVACIALAVIRLGLGTWGLRPARPQGLSGHNCAGALLRSGKTARDGAARSQVAGLSGNPERRQRSSSHFVLTAAR